MSYRIEKNYITGKPELVMAGFEKGIADSPYTGIADMRNMNIITSPGQASVEFQMSAMTVPPVYTGVSFTVAASDDTFTTASTAGFYNGMAIFLATLSGGTGLNTGVVYYVGSITSTTFKVYTDYTVSFSPVNITVDGSGTFTTFQFGNQRGKSTFSNYPDIKHTVNNANGNVYVIDRSGYAWFFVSDGSIISSYTPNNCVLFLGNYNPGGGTNSSADTASTSANGIVFWKNYLFLFWTAGIDYVKVGNLVGSTPAAQWHYAWQSISPTIPVPSIAATDDVIYFGLGSDLGSILENANETFDPTDSTTYTFNATALSIPLNDQIVSLGQLGTNLLVGGILNYVYPWNRIATSFSYPLVVAESNIRSIVSTNSNAYIFAGNRGRIYITNGNNIGLWKKIPDYLSGVQNPYYTWMDTLYERNQIYFAFYAEDNTGTNLDNTAGIWAIDLDTGAFRMMSKFSYAGYTGNAVFVAPNFQGRLPEGESIFSAYTTTFLGSTFGAEVSVSTPYQAGEPYVDFDIIPVGTFITPQTFSNIEFKLSKPLVSGEYVSLYQRSNLNDAFTLIGTSNTAGLISYPFRVNWQGVQWLQIRAVTSSISSGGSGVPLLEVRARN